MTPVLQLNKQMVAAGTASLVGRRGNFEDRQTGSAYDGCPFPFFFFFFRIKFGFAFTCVGDGSLACVKRNRVFNIC